MTITRFSFPTTIQFGPGASKLAGPHLKGRGLKRPLVVTDKGLAALPLLAEFTASLAVAGLAPAVYAGVFGNPTGSQVMNGAAAYRAHGADCVVGLGGGAALDVAKVVGLLASHEGDVMEYVWDHPKVRTIGESLPYFVALPTTAGTGSEVGRSSVISEEDTHVKRVIFSAQILARVVFADPELTVGLPPGLTAATGMDAIAHCLETFMAPAVNPPADGIALDGLQRGWAHIERATRDGHDLEARWQMMSASMQGALAFQKGLGCVHSLSHSLGGVDPRLHHGTLNAMFLPAVIRFNAGAESIRHEHRLQRIAQAIGLPGCDAQGNAVAIAIQEMNVALGLPEGLAAMGVTTALFERVIDGAMADHCHKTNPRIATREDYRAMLEASM